MNSSALQLEQQQNTLQSIIKGIEIIEETVSAERLKRESKQVIEDMLSQLRCNALNTINDRSIGERILYSYKQDAVDSLAGFQGLLFDELCTLDTDAPCADLSDGQIQMFALAAQDLACKAYRYLEKKAGEEVDHG